jgi:hypothetical protein
MAAGGKTTRNWLNERWVAVGMVGVSFLAALAISWRAKQAATPVFSEEPVAPTSDGIAGFPGSVTMKDHLTRARELTPRTELVAISVEGSLPDGRVNVSKGGSVRYVFRSREGEGPQAKRPYGTLARRMYCGQQSVSIEADGIGARRDQPRASCRSLTETLPDPGCSLKALWEVAKERAIEAKTARIEYFASNAGPAWRFLPEGGKPFALAADCKTELRGGDAARKEPAATP